MGDLRKSKSYCPGDRQIALFLDLDNFNLRAGGKEIALLLGALEPWGKVAIRRAYGRSFSHRRDLSEQLLQYKFLVQQCPCVAGKKNGADIRITVEIMEMLHTRPGIRTFALATGDSDFLALVERLHEHKCSVIGAGGKKTSSAELVQSCDRFLFYEDFLTGNRSGEIAEMSTPFRIGAEAMRTVLRRRNLYPPDPRARTQILHFLTTLNSRRLTFRDLQQQVIVSCEANKISKNSVRHCMYALTRANLLVKREDVPLGDRLVHEIPGFEAMQNALARLMADVLLSEENVLADPMAMAEAIWDDTSRTGEMETIIEKITGL